MPEKAKICSAGFQGCDPALCPISILQDPEIHHLIITAAKAASPSSHI